MQVLGNGRCLVSFEPESSGPHKIDIRFNSENVPGRLNYETSIFCTILMYLICKYVTLKNRN